MKDGSCYFERPTQVMFYDGDGLYGAGIAYGDDTICACCGSVMSNEEIAEMAAEDHKEPFVCMPWVSFKDEIQNDDFDETPTSESTCQ